MSEDEDPLREARAALVALTQLLAASIAASLARAGGALGPSAERCLWPVDLPEPLDIAALRAALGQLPLARRPIARSPVIDDVLALLPDRMPPTSLSALTLEVANLLLHLGLRLEKTAEADEKFVITLATWSCVVEGYFVLATLLAAGDEGRLFSIGAKLDRAIEELIALAARCGGSVKA